jgi:hypothetical protein
VPVDVDARVPCRVNELEWIVPSIRVTVQVLRVAGLWYNGVGLDPPVKIRRVESRAIVIQRAERGLFRSLAGETVIGW